MATDFRLMARRAAREVGLAVLAGVACGLVIYTLRARDSERQSEEFMAPSRIEVLESRTERRGDHLRILGRLRVVSDYRASFRFLEADFFDATGRFMARCSDPHLRSFLPAQEAYFVMSCPGEELPEGSFTRYEISLGPF